MQKKILVFELCTELEQELVRQQLNPDTLKRYRKVLKEFSVFGGEEVYSQPLGTEFLIQKFKADGGISITDEHSRTEAYYYKCIRILAEYYNFGIVHIRNDFKGEIIWPDGFRTCTESLLASGENRHSGSGRNSHFRSDRKRQCTSCLLP